MCINSSKALKDQIKHLTCFESASIVGMENFSISLTNESGSIPINNLAPT